jgi:hypothetical protein
VEGADLAVIIADIKSANSVVCGVQISKKLSGIAGMP